MKETGIGLLTSLSLLLAAAVGGSYPGGAVRTRPALSQGSAAWQPEGPGVLEGQVLVRGSTTPKSTQIENTTDPQHCGKVQSLENIVISPHNRGIKDAILSLTGVPLPEDYQAPVSRLVLDNRQCRFEPHASVLTTGSTIEAVNSDPIFHSVHLYGFMNINLALGPKSSKAVQIVRRPGMIVVKCDVHGWMQAFIRVDSHPFHSVSANDGAFRIKGLPAGSYNLEVWHEYFGSKELPITVSGKAPSKVTIYYSETSANLKEE